MTEREDPEDRLRRLFRELAERDRAAAPPFARALARRAPERASPSRGRRALFAAAALVLVAFGVVWSRRLRSGATPSGSVADWTSPTAFLLETPGAELLDTVPALPEPVPDYSSAEPPVRKGASS